MGQLLCRISNVQDMICAEMIGGEFQVPEGIVKKDLYKIADLKNIFVASHQGRDRTVMVFEPWLKNHYITEQTLEECLDIKRRADAYSAAIRQGII